MESLHMNQKSFAQATGINEGTLSGIINKKTRPSIQIVEAIHNRLPNISVSWLMFGTGSMYENDSRTTPSNNNVQQQGSSDVSATSSVTTTEQPAKGALRLRRPCCLMLSTGLQTLLNVLLPAIITVKKKLSNILTNLLEKSPKSESSTMTRPTSHSCRRNEMAIIDLTDL